MGNKTFESGYFKKHNDAVMDRLKNNPDAVAAFTDYAKQVGDDAQALVDAGASKEQMAASRQALIDRAPEAFQAIVHGTKHGEK